MRGGSLKTALWLQAGNGFHPTVLTATVVRICWQEPDGLCKKRRQVCFPCFVSRISSTRLPGNQPTTFPVTLKIPSVREGLSITVFHIPHRNSLRYLMQIRWTTRAVAVSAGITYPTPCTHSGIGASRHTWRTATCAAARWSPLPRHRHRHESTDRSAHGSAQRHCPAQSPLLPALATSPR
jgi:hypothetical protein